MDDKRFKTVDGRIKFDIQTLTSNQQLIFDQMTSKRQRTTGSHRSCPNSSQTIKEDPLKDFNPQFQQLSSKKLTLPSNSRPQTPPPTPESIKELLLNTLSSHFELRFPHFHSICLRWIVGEWRGTRLNMQSRLSKIRYLSPTLAFDSFAAVEREVRLEWQKNHLLKGLTYLWTHSFCIHEFTTLEKASQFYEGYCHTFAIVSYSLFESCFRGMEEKGMDVMGILIRNTACTTVTELKQWREIYANKLEPLFLKDSSSFSENFHIGNIEMNPRVLNVDSPRHAFQFTGSALESLITSLTLDDAVSRFQTFRNCLLKQIGESIECENEGRQWKCVIPEKQDILGCIIYTLVRYKLDNVGCFLAYLAFLLGKDIDTVLHNRKVDCYRADLEASYWYVSHPVVKIDYSGSESI